MGSYNRKFQSLPLSQTGMLKIGEMPEPYEVVGKNGSKKYHIVRSEYLEEQNAVHLKGAGVCGRKVVGNITKTDIQSPNAICEDCLKWMNQTMENHLYDDAKHVWYNPKEEDF